jgi:hypothetical protein
MSRFNHQRFGRFIFSMLAAPLCTLMNTAEAVSVNSQGIGEALIYPYYTVRNDQSTLLSVVNDGKSAKALKVLIREAKNGIPVLSFNLFLNPRDIWTAAIAAGSDGGALLLSTDASCTNPRLSAGGVPFRDYALFTDVPALQTIDRMREGFVEIIEMASIKDDSPTAVDIRFTATNPPRCQLVVNAEIQARVADYVAPTGGISGTGTVISASMSTGYAATALEGLELPLKLTASSDVVGSTIATGLSKTARLTVYNAETSSTSTIAADFVNSIDAVSAVLMVDSLRGEYARDGVFSTDWVITAPTKPFYTNQGNSEFIGATTATTGPFAKAWDRTTGVACTPVGRAAYDRETKVSTIATAPSPDMTETSLCWASTVASFNNASTPTSSFLRSVNTMNFPVFAGSASASGYATLSLNAAAAVPSSAFYLESLPSSRITVGQSNAADQTLVGPVRFFGLPVIGVSIVAAKFASGTGNFNSSSALAGKQSIVRVTTTP